MKVLGGPAVAIGSYQPRDLPLRASLPLLCFLAVISRHSYIEFCG